MALVTFTSSQIMINTILGSTVFTLAHQFIFYAHKYSECLNACGLSADTTYHLRSMSMIVWNALCGMKVQTLKNQTCLASNLDEGDSIINIIFLSVLHELSIELSSTSWLELTNTESERRVASSKKPTQQFNLTAATKRFSALELSRYETSADPVSYTHLTLPTILRV